MIFGAIAAGGSGTRMGGPLPKQFLCIGEKPVIIITLEKFLKEECFSAVYIGVGSEWVSYTEELIDRYLSEKYKTRRRTVHVTVGGSDRNSTVFRILDSIEEEFGDISADIIVTHDAVRPFVTGRMIRESIEAASVTGAAGTAVPSVDTILESADGITVDAIPDRSRMYSMQTPQTFRIGLLRELYASLTEDEKNVLTDACRICLMRGIPVRLIKGEDTNIKLTTPKDMKLAALLAEEEKTKEKTDE